MTTPTAAASLFSDLFDLAFRAVELAPDPDDLTAADLGDPVADLAFALGALTAAARNGRLLVVCEALAALAEAEPGVFAWDPETVGKASSVPASMPVNGRTGPGTSRGGEAT